MVKVVDVKTKRGVDFAEHLQGSSKAMTKLMKIICFYLLYSGKVWQGESLTNLANRPRFAKLKPSKLVLTINNLLADLLICQMLETSQFAKHPPPTKLSRYTVCRISYKNTFVV